MDGSHRHTGTVLKNGISSLISILVYVYGGEKQILSHSELMF